MQSNNLETKAVARPPSDGSELIPAEVQASLDNNKKNRSSDKSLKDGYTVDDEGIINNYAIEPNLIAADYPAPYQQRRYLGQATIAMGFIAFILWVAFAVS